MLDDRRRPGLGALQPFLDALQHREEGRHEQHRQAGRGDHAAHHAHAERDARGGAGAGRGHQRHHAEDEGERRHQDRAQPGDGRLDRRLGIDLPSTNADLARHLDDQDGVLGAERDQQHQADLGVEVVGQADQGKRDRGADERQRHGEDHAERRDPALVLAGEAEIDQQDGEREDIDDLVADDRLLVGHRRPFVGRARRQCRCGDFVHQRQ